MWWAQPYKLSEFVDVIATPGHTSEDVSVRVRSRHQGLVIIAGDLFEREEDIRDPSLWRSAGSQDPDRQMANRRRVLAEADLVVPGHGPMFAVTAEHRRLESER
ncbi:metallo-beta-lactamase domain-containing protein 1-like isoform X2 [Pollicipes pollicipes]|uniref:metallo-beta-lactamase domain-containing protein 1-like isoform X2 n=1 Tax=Pollicipes pollicipes TaxID=41117 RepID=UPI00188520EB|nr:metallo-beta-lactamase domain-containing protein 1-like isoform X2 [Pollicipes pollicipes]